MSKLKEYLEQKRIRELELPKLYVVKSTKEGVEKPMEMQVIQIKKNVGISHTQEGKVSIHRYFVNNSPFEIDILEGKTNAIDMQYGSGCGDLWGYTYFSSLLPNEADEFYDKELERVNQKYKTK